MRAPRITSLNTAAVMTLLGALAALGSGCAAFSSKPTVEFVAKPSPTALTPARDRLTDEALHADLNFLERLRVRAEELPVTSALRAEATAWLEGAQTEYLAESRDPWVDEAAAQAARLLQNSTPAPTASAASEVELASATLRGLDAWTIHVRATRGFRAALPLLERAEPLRALAGLKPTAPTKNDFRTRDYPESLYNLQRRLAALYDQGKVPLGSYAWAKTQAWLDFALDEHFARDRSGLVSRVSKYASELVRALEAMPASDANALAVACQTPSTLGRGHPKDVYPDLWDTTVSAHSEEFLHHLTEYAPRLAALAKLEVALLHAAHERGERGARTAHPFEQAARRIAGAFSSATP